MRRLQLTVLVITNVLFPLPPSIRGLAYSPPTRRKWLAQALLGATTAASPPPADAADGELPLALRDYTKLAPLGGAATNRPSLEGKATNLSLNELASKLTVDLGSGHTGQGGYFISGDLDPSLYRNDCVFVDPTNRVTSLGQYQNALRILFDPTQSTVEVLGPLAVDEDRKTIQAKIRSRGVLQLPWRPYTTAYESTIVYRIEDGLIAEQTQTWSKSAYRALQESFTPGWFRPAPKSILPKASNSSEPPAVTKLFQYVNGRRPQEYSQAERMEIDALIDQIAKNTESYSFQPNQLLPGKWMLVYLQPGPTGIGIDRRIPFFPDFDFNDNFQVFSPDSVVNIGQVLGPLLQVSVQGDLERGDIPRRFVANIKGGKICWRQTAACAELPISGQGLFDSVYLGERLRIGQNINGGGARVVQVRLE